MRNALVGAAGSVALLVTTLVTTPAQAVPSPIRVDGNHFAASGLRLVSQGCADPATRPSTPPRFKPGSGPGRPPLGVRSAGWNVRTTEFAVGPEAKLASPSHADVVRMSLFSKASHISGVAVATYYAPADGGVWRGTAGVTSDSVAGWHTVSAASASFTWRHYTNGTYDQTAPTSTFVDFVNAHGGDNGTGYLGFAYGCDGSDFLVDKLQVGSSTGYRTYDFEGFATKTLFENAKKTPKKIIIVAGKRVGLTAELRKKFDGQGLAGRLKIQNRKLSQQKWSTYATPKVGGTGDYDFKVRPFVSSAYRLSYAGTTSYEASSRLLKILVRPYVTASFDHATVTKGHTFTLRGRILPARHAAIKLQHYVDGSWRTVRKGSSGNDGRYAMSAVTRKVGRSYWRIFVKAGGGNISGKSPWNKLKTVAPPPPPNDPTPPPPTTTTSTPPPPPPDDPPPPPPPSH